MMPTPEEREYLEGLGFGHCTFGATHYWVRDGDIVQPTSKGKWWAYTGDFQSPPLDTVFAAVAYAEVENWGR